MAITNGIGYVWEIKFVDGYYMPVEEAFATLDEVYKFIKDYKTSIECVRITKVGIEDDEWDFLENVKEATDTYFEKAEKESEKNYYLYRSKKTGNFFITSAHSLSEAHIFATEYCDNPIYCKEVSEKWVDEHRFGIY